MTTSHLHKKKGVSPYYHYWLKGGFKYERKVSYLSVYLHRRVSPWSKDQGYGDPSRDTEDYLVLVSSNLLKSSLTEEVRERERLWNYVYRIIVTFGV